MIKRTVLMVVLWLSICGFALFSQTTVCNDLAIMSLKGKWTAPRHAPRPSPKEVTSEQYLQVAKRADAVHPLLLEAYPEPVGMQAGRWWRSGGGPGFFRLLAYNYIGALSPYFCAPNAQPGSILAGLGAPSKPVYEAGGALTNLQVHFNDFGDPGFGFMRALREMAVGGFQVFHRLRPTGAWKGYDLYVTKSIQTDGLVILTRKGMLPYRPVTRKQYLDSMIATFQRQYEDTVAAANEVLRSPDASRVPEFAEGAKRSLADAAKVKDDMSAPFQESLKKHAADGTLGSPAIVADKTPLTEDIFTTEEKGGQALVTVNPNYFRKDLPSYVPQFIVVHWMWQSGVASANFKQLVEANFPIEKLQAMIDK